MYRLLTLTAAATVLATGSLVPSRAEASPLSVSRGANLAIEALAPIEKVAFCFYEDGWNGPGFYECGFQRRQGQGWHGPRDGTTDRSGSGGGSSTTNTTTNTGDTTTNTGTGAGATTSTSTKTGGATYTGAGAGATSTEATTTTGGATTTTGGTGAGATSSKTGGTAGGMAPKK
jgi:hypothetical protein